MSEQLKYDRKQVVYVDMLKNGGSLKINVHCLIFGDYGA